MKDHSECKRQFIQLSRAWYASACQVNSEKVDRVNIGFYHPEGGTTGEFEVSWEYLGNRLVPSITAFDDAWDALIHFSDLLSAMAELDNQNVPPDEFCQLLVQLGIEDCTPTENNDLKSVGGYFNA